MKNQMWMIPLFVVLTLGLGACADGTVPGDLSEHLQSLDTVELEISDDDDAVFPIEFDPADEDEEFEVEDNDSPEGESPNTGDDGLENEDVGLDQDDDGEGKLDDDGDLEMEGEVEDITDEYVVINGTTFYFTEDSEFADEISLGDYVEVYFFDQDGRMVVREIELEDLDGDDLNDDSQGISDLNDDDDFDDDSSNDDDDDDHHDDHDDDDHEDHHDDHDDDDDDYVDDDDHKESDDD